MFCKHVWEVKVEKFVDSFLERSRCSRVNSCNTGLAESTHIVIISCEKCGKIDKTITRC